MFRLTPKDKRIIFGFLKKKREEVSSKKMYTNGIRLDGLWMGGSCIAYWDKSGDYIIIRDLGSKSAQTVQRLIKKNSSAKVVWEDEYREIKRKKILELNSVIEEYYMMVGSSKRPTQKYLEQCWNLGMIDEEIRRIEELLLGY